MKLKFDIDINQFIISKGKISLELVINAVIKIFLPEAVKKIETGNFHSLDPTLREQGCHIRAFKLLNLLKTQNVKNFSKDDEIFLSLMELTHQLTTIKYYKFGLPKTDKTSDKFNFCNKIREKILIFTGNPNKKDKRRLEKLLLFNVRYELVNSSRNFLCHKIQNVNSELSDILIRGQCMLEITLDSYHFFLPVLPLFEAVKSIFTLLKNDKMPMLLNLRTIVRNNDGELELSSIWPVILGYNFNNELKITQKYPDENSPILTFDIFRIINLFDSNLTSGFQIIDPQEFIKNISQRNLEKLMLSMAVAHPQLPGNNIKSENFEKNNCNSILNSEYQQLMFLVKKLKLNIEKFLNTDTFTGKEIPIAVEHVYVSTLQHVKNTKLNVNIVYDPVFQDFNLEDFDKDFAALTFLAAFYVEIDFKVNINMNWKSTN